MEVIVDLEAIMNLIHPIHLFKSSHWLKEGHMTWISFDNVLTMFLLGTNQTNPCVLVFTIS